jgi:hypothetical protein
LDGSVGHELDVWGYVWILAAAVASVGFRRTSAMAWTAASTTAAMDGGAILATVLLFQNRLLRHLRFARLARLGI